MFDEYYQMVNDERIDVEVSGDRLEVDWFVIEIVD